MYNVDNSNVDISKQKNKCESCKFPTPVIHVHMMFKKITLSRVQMLNVKTVDQIWALYRCRIGHGLMNPI